MRQEQNIGKLGESLLKIDSRIKSFNAKIEKDKKNMRDKRMSEQERTKKLIEEAEEERQRKMNQVNKRMR